VKVRDRSRYQLYKIYIDQIKNILSPSILSLSQDASFVYEKNILNSVLETVAEELDKIILPSVVTLIQALKKDNKGLDYYGIMEKITPKVLFHSFPFIKETCDVFTSTIQKAIVEAILRFKSDIPEIESTIVDSHYEKLNRIEILGDRHNNGRTTLKFICQNYSIMYKPVSLQPELTFRHILNILNLGQEYLSVYPKIISRADYGWIEYIEPKRCQTHSELTHYYKRAGAYLGLCFFLNFSDGHGGNLIASGEYPVLIDMETMFQSISFINPRFKKCVIHTGLIQIKPRSKGKGFHSAFQAITKYDYYPFEAYPINERTPEIEVRYKGLRGEEKDNLPRFNGEIVTIHDFESDFIAGFEYIYNYVIQHKKSLLENIALWELLDSVRVRAIIRTTLYYRMLIGKTHQPLYNIGGKGYIKEQFQTYLYNEKNINLKALFDYEVQALMDQDIPYFWTKPTSTSIFDNQNNEYKNMFLRSGVEEMRHFIKHASKSYNRVMKTLHKCITDSPQV
jgi:lantibiotic modifying enzyme